MEEPIELYLVYSFEDFACADPTAQQAIMEAFGVAQSQKANRATFLLTLERWQEIGDPLPRSWRSLHMLSVDPAGMGPAMFFRLRSFKSRL